MLSVPSEEVFAGLLDEAFVLAFRLQKEPHTVMIQRAEPADDWGLCLLIGDIPSYAAILAVTLDGAALSVALDPSQVRHPEYRIERLEIVFDANERDTVERALIALELSP